MSVKLAAKTKAIADARTPVVVDVVSADATLPTRISKARRKGIRSDALAQPTQQGVDQTPKDDAADESSPSSPNPIATRKRDRAGVLPEAGTASEAASPSDADQRTAAHALSPSKAERVLTLLRGERGATLAELQAATGWQAHSVRGFLSGTVRKRMGLPLVSQPDEAGARRYALAKA